jgi:hypothetical protein
MFQLLPVAGIDHGENCLSFRQVELAGKEGAHSQLTRPGGSRSQTLKPRDQQLDNWLRRQDVQLDQVLPRVRVWAREEIEIRGQRRGHLRQPHLPLPPTALLHQRDW